MTSPLPVPRRGLALANRAEAPEPINTKLGARRPSLCSPKPFSRVEASLNMTELRAALSTLSSEQGSESGTDDDVPYDKDEPRNHHIVIIKDTTNVPPSILSPTSVGIPETPASSPASTKVSFGEVKLLPKLYHYDSDSSVQSDAGTHIEGEDAPITSPDSEIQRYLELNDAVEAVEQYRQAAISRLQHDGDDENDMVHVKYDIARRKPTPYPAEHLDHYFDDFESDKDE